MERFRPRRVLVTGGAGFIGSSVVRALLESPELELEQIVVLDALTYAGHRANLEGLEHAVSFVEGDICDASVVAEIFKRDRPDALIHLAAESHVDRSIESAAEFVRTNVHGTFTLLDAARHASSAGHACRFVHVSTDEVFGALGHEGFFTETSPYAPNSPYAASKAASDLLVRSYFKTYSLPTVITNCCNNYGPRQLPEKLVPLMITNAATDKRLPVYGEGLQIREWLHVDDHAAGLLAALQFGRTGESYNFGSGEELSNRQMVERIATVVDEHLDRARGTSHKLIQFVPDRKGHDFRYAIDSSKAKRELGWTPKRDLTSQLADTVKWYLSNHHWIEKVSTKEHERFQAAYYPRVTEVEG